MTDTPVISPFPASPLQRYGVDRLPLPINSADPKGAEFKSDKSALTIEQQIASYEKAFLDIMSDKSQFYGKMTQLGMRPAYNTQINGLMRGLSFSESKGSVSVKTNAGADWQSKDKSAEERLKLITEKLSQARDLVALSKENKEARATSALHTRLTASPKTEHLSVSPNKIEPKITETETTLKTTSSASIISPPILGAIEPGTILTGTVSEAGKPTASTIDPKATTTIATDLTASTNTNTATTESTTSSTTPPSNNAFYVPANGPASDAHVDYDSIIAVLDQRGLRGERLRRNELELKDLDQALYFAPGGILVRSKLFDSFNQWLDALDKADTLKGDQRTAEMEKATEAFTKNVDNVLKGSAAWIADARNRGAIGTTQRLMQSYENSKHDPHFSSAAVHEVAEKNGISLSDEDFLLRNEDGFKILQLILETDTRGRGNEQRLALYNHFSAEKPSLAKTNDGRANDKSLGWKDRIEALAAWKGEEVAKLGDNQIAKEQLEAKYQKRAAQITDEFRKEVEAIVRDAAGLPKERHGLDKFFHDLGEAGKRMLPLVVPFVPGAAPLAGVGALATRGGR